MKLNSIQSMSGGKIKEEKKVSVWSKNYVDKLKK